MNEKPAVTILLVEDDAGHARLIEKNLRRAHMGTPKVLAHLGERAYLPLQDRVIAAVLSDDLRSASGFP